MCAGDIELFHDEIAAYARDLRGAGVEVTLDVVEGGAHGFENWAAASDLTRALLQRAWTWLRTALDVEERTSRQRG
jgi:acetyl esterase/lipase